MATPIKPIEALSAAIVNFQPKSRISQMHLANRTSPKGQAFIGTCSLCGKPGLTFEAVRDEVCPNQRGLTSDQAVIEAITGEPRA